MNGPRIHGAQSLEERLAAVAVSLRWRLTNLLHHEPDYADFRDAFRPYVRIEILVARLDALRTPHVDRDKKVREIVQELADMQFETPGL
jgi:hypothetical protein